MTNPAAWLVSPNQMMANGIQASGGMGRRISMIGSSRKSATRNHPIKTPMGMPRRSATMSPIPKCSRLTMVSVRKVPDSKSSTNAPRTSLTLGRMKDCPTTYSATICQITATTMIDAMPSNRFCVFLFMASVPLRGLPAGRRGEDGLTPEGSSLISSACL